MKRAKKETSSSLFPSAKQVNIATVLLHDYFHHGVFQEVIGEKQWDRLDSRLDKNTDQVCALLEAYNVKATFFTLGWIADKYPEIIRKITLQGHEIANAGYSARSVRQMKPGQFREDLRRSKAALERAGANKILGYRSAYQWFRKNELWALDILIEEGYRYDASYRPGFLNVFERSGRKIIHEHRSAKGKIWELPASTATIMGINFPISGGGYFRHFPHTFMFNNYLKWCRRSASPFILYFLPWELDYEQPVINAIGNISKFRRYRNLGKMQQVLPRYFEKYEFQNVSKFLDLPVEFPAIEQDAANTAIQRLMPEFKVSTTGPSHSACPLAEVSVIVPCYNEENSIDYLAKALNELIYLGSKQYRFKPIFVDDGSTDNTYATLKKRFGECSACTYIRHDKNRGIAAAIETGIHQADTEIVCSMDADCSFDPLELIKMIPILNQEVDIVTASPYHKEGFVFGVPKWRLFLSKSLSRIYHRVLNHKLASYSACFRVYRRSSVSSIKVSCGDFRGVVEFLAIADLNGLTIKEFPTTLQSRIYGHSKMKVLKTIHGHIKLLREIIKRRNQRQLKIQGKAI